MPLDINKLSQCAAHSRKAEQFDDKNDAGLASSHHVVPEIIEKMMQLM